MVCPGPEHRARGLRLHASQGPLRLTVAARTRHSHAPERRSNRAAARRRLRDRAASATPRFAAKRRSAHPCTAHDASGRACVDGLLSHTRAAGHVKLSDTVRILLVSQMYPGPEDPDLGAFVQGIERALAERGHEIERAVTEGRGGGKWRHLRLARDVRRAAKPDVVYAHFLVP